MADQWCDLQKSVGCCSRDGSRDGHTLIIAGRTPPESPHRRGAAPLRDKINTVSLPNTGQATPPSGLGRADSLGRTQSGVAVKTVSAVSWEEHQAQLQSQREQNKHADASKLSGLHRGDSSKSHHAANRSPSPLGTRTRSHSAHRDDHHHHPHSTHFHQPFVNRLGPHVQGFQ